MKLACTAAAALLICLGVPGAHASRLTGISLKPLDPALVDDVLESSNATTRAAIRFVNQSSGPVDIYWIDYDGHRKLIKAGLAVGDSHLESTFLTHPFLVVASGSGATTAQDSGTRLAGFMALTSRGDTAIISDSK